MAFRSPGRYDYADDFRRGGGESWDRERLERVGRQIGDRGSFGGRPFRSSRFEEPDPYYEEEPRYGRPRRPDFLDEPSQAEVANRALAPYRRKSIHERDADIPVRRPPRPKYVRRQSSLDTFDRRPLPRYGDHVYEEEYQQHQHVPVPLPIRSREPNLYHPPRHFKEHEYESVHYHHHDHSDSDSHSKISVHQNRSKASRSVKAKTVRSSSSSSSSSSGVTATTLKSRNKVGKRGKTRIPKRLAKREVIINFGYPYDEEDDCYVIRRALGKEHIDEVIRVSKTYKESVTTYRYDEPKDPEPIVVPEPVPQKTEVEQTTVIKEFGDPPAPKPIHYHPPPEPVLVEPPPHHHHHVHREHHHPPPEPVLVEPPPHHHHHVRRDHYYEEPGPLVVAKPHHHHHHGHAHRHDREIQAEIHALEAEKRALKLEREAENKLVMADRVRDGESAYGVVDSKEKDVVRIEKDRKANPKIVAAMMATLT